MKPEFDEFQGDPKRDISYPHSTDLYSILHGAFELNFMHVVANM